MRCDTPSPQVLGSPGMAAWAQGMSSVSSGPLCVLLQAHAKMHTHTHTKMYSLLYINVYIYVGNVHMHNLNLFCFSLCGFCGSQGF